MKIVCTVFGNTKIAGLNAGNITSFHRVGTDLYRTHYLKPELLLDLLEMTEQGYLVSGNNYVGLDAYKAGSIQEYYAMSFIQYVLKMPKSN